MLSVLGIVVFVLGLLGSIALHEIGHMVPAKKFGVRVPQYMVGFGPTLWSKVRGETEFGVKAIPMGGYIRMIGMYPPAQGSRREATGRFTSLIEETRMESLDEVAPGEEHRTFYSLSVPKKLVVMFGGPFMNLVLAFILFAVSLSAIGSLAPTNQVKSIVACVPTSSNLDGLASTDGSCADGVASSATLLGIQQGDVVKSVNGQAINEWFDLAASLKGTAGKTVEVVIERQGALIKKSVRIAQITDPTLAREPGQGFLGVTPELATVRQSLTEIPGVVAEQTKSAVSALVGFPRAILTLGQTLTSDEPRDPTGPVGVIGIGRITGEISADTQFSASAKLGTLVGLLAGLNLFLFLFNLVPILPLDGGHIASALFEGLRRSIARVRKISPLPGPSDTARMLPMTYVVAVVMIGTSILVAIADVIKPITLG